MVQIKEYLNKRQVNKITVESWAGSSTKIAGYIGMLESLYNNRNYKPDIINGISGGAIISILRLKLILDSDSMNEIIELGTEFNLETIFKDPPFNKKRIKIKSIINLVKGKPALSSHEKLLDSLFSIFTKQDFYNYKHDSKLPIVLICSTNMENGSLRIVNIKEKCYTYSDLKKDLLASTSIPMVMEPILINDQYHHDGGVRYSNAGFYIINKLLKQGVIVKQHVSLYSRPRDLTDIIKDPIDRTKKTFFRFSGRFLLRVFKIRMYQNSKFCETSELKQARQHKIVLKQFFLPNILKSFFDTDEKLLKKLYEEGKKSIGRF